MMLSHQEEETVSTGKPLQIYRERKNRRGKECRLRSLETGLVNCSFSDFQILELPLKIIRRLGNSLMTTSWTDINANFPLPSMHFFLAKNQISICMNLLTTRENAAEEFIAIQCLCSILADDVRMSSGRHVKSPWSTQSLSLQASEINPREGKQKKRLLKGTPNKKKECSKKSFQVTYVVPFCLKSHLCGSNT